VTDSYLQAAIPRLWQDISAKVHSSYSSISKSSPTAQHIVCRCRTRPAPPPALQPQPRSALDWVRSDVSCRAPGTAPLPVRPDGKEATEEQTAQSQLISPLFDFLQCQLETAFEEKQ